MNNMEALTCDEFIAEKASLDKDYIDEFYADIIKKWKTNRIY